MKTTLHGLQSLNESPGEFNDNVAKHGDNGGAETEAEVEKYLAEYRRRSGVDCFINALEDQSRNFLTRFAERDTPIY